MVQSLRYGTVSDVLESWSKLQRIQNYEEVAGIKLFQRFFTACPAAKAVFGFPLDASPASLIEHDRKRFVRHATILLNTIDTALHMLGPDIEFLTEMMIRLGPKHVKYGVTVDMFPILGQCLIDTLAECLNDAHPGSFPASSREAWNEVFCGIASDIMQAYNHH